MRNKLILLIALLCSAASLAFATGDNAPSDPAASAPKVKVLVTPFENGAAANSLSAYSLVYAAHLAERLEASASIEPVNDALVLSAAQARLVSPKGRQFDLAAANRLARAKGAAYFVTGRYSGQTWTWVTEVSVYRAGTQSPELVGTSSVKGDMTDLLTVTRRNGTTYQVRTNSAKNLFELFGQAAGPAFADAGIAVEPEVLAAVATPPYDDAFAVLRLGRAYVRHFNGEGALDAAELRDLRSLGEDDEETDPALGLARVVAKGYPELAEAQRLYAALLEKAGKDISARTFYEVAVAASPKDWRSLLQLGRLELKISNPEIAVGYLTRAAELRPLDGDPAYWKGLSLLQLGRGDEGVAALETARTLDPMHGQARKELANEYAARKRYREAAAELAFTGEKIEPANASLPFLQSACLRAAGDRTAARTALIAAEGRFPKDARFRKFAGDLSMMDGDVAAAQREYRAALGIDPDDRRLTAAFGSVPVDQMPVGGASLLAAIGQMTSDVASTESTRELFQLAANDAIADLSLNGDKACVDGRAASSALLAKETGERHRATAKRLSDDAAKSAAAIRDGETAFLTPDELAATDRGIAGSTQASLDGRGMAGQFLRELLPLYEAKGCADFDGPVTAVTREELEKRNRGRKVALPKYEAPASVMSFTPVIDPDEVRKVSVYVDNRAGQMEKEFWLDGKPAGTVAAGAKPRFETSLGYHKMCLVPKGAECGKPGTLRMAFLHDGWTYKVRAAD